MMNASSILALALPLLLTGCNGALVGNVVVLCVTFGIFFGTLRLGRSSGEATRSEAPTSTAGRT